MEETITGVGVLDKSIAVLDVVETQPMTASDLARELGMTLSTVHRLAMAMATHGLLWRDESGCFHPGLRFVTSTIAEVSRPILVDLTAATGESSQLWVRRGTVRLCSVSVDSKEELRAVLPVGSQLPLSGNGSAARILLGELESTDGSPPRPDWIESVAQRTLGIGSVSAPVRLHGSVVAVVCLIGPMTRLNPSPGQLHGDRVVAAARQIETGLGTVGGSLARRVKLHHVAVSR